MVSTWRLFARGSAPVLGAALLLAALIFALPFDGQVARAQVILETFDTYTQDFNSLGGTGTLNEWINDSTLKGWYSNRTTYVADSGNSTIGGLHSYGSLQERALGSLATDGTGAIYFGLRLKNGTDTPITSLEISYTGEHWRIADNVDKHKLAFAYQVGEEVSGLVGGTWHEAPDFDFTDL